MICKACNAENENGAQFCVNCGAALEQEAAPVEEVVAPVEEVAAPVEEVVAPVEEVAAPAEEATAEVPASDPGKLLNLISLICGAVGLVFSSLCTCLGGCLGGFIPMLIGVAAIVTGLLGMNKSKAAGFKNTLGLIGLILGIASVAAFILFIVGSFLLSLLGYAGGANASAIYGY